MGAVDNIKAKIQDAQLEKEFSEEYHELDDGSDVETTSDEGSVWDESSGKWRSAEFMEVIKELEA